ncbi:MAG: ArgE/DapE family deacylase [Bacteroidota bacterium]
MKISNFIPQNRLLKLLQRMISIPSINPDLSADGTGESELADFLGNYLESHGFEVEIQDLQEGRKNTVAMWKGSGGGQSLMLNGHIDTVGIQGMTIDPFDPVFKEGKIYGRGSMDMKSGVAAQIMAAIALKEAGFQPTGDLILACVADEEYESIGTQALLQSYRADAGIVTEPTDLEMVLAHKGFVWSEILVEGVAAHGSRPEVGIDAILQAGKILNGLSELEETILPAIQHPLLGRGSVHASLIEGGSEMSIYPDSCKISIERRTLPGESLESIQQELDQIITQIKKGSPQFTANARAYLERHPLEVSPEEAIVKAFLPAYKRTLGKSASPTGIGFWTDAALMAHAGTPTLIFGPRGKGLHGAVEYVEWESVVQTTEILAQVIQTYTV